MKTFWSLQEMLKRIISETGLPRLSNLTRTNADSNLLAYHFIQRAIALKEDQYVPLCLIRGLPPRLHLNK